MFGYIYETTNLINGKKYIGKHKSNKFDNNYLGSGISLGRAINKYGKENFSIKILEEINTNQEDLDNKETYYIEKYNAVKDKNYYNHSYGGKEEGWQGFNKARKENPTLGGMYGKHHTKESKNKISISKKEKFKNLNEIEKYHIGAKERWKDLKQRQEQSERFKGKNNPRYGKPSTFKGKHHTTKTKEIISNKAKERLSNTEERNKISARFKGKPLSEEHKKKISENHADTSGENNAMAKKCKLEHNGVIRKFGCIKDLMNYLKKEYNLKLNHSFILTLLNTELPYNPRCKKHAKAKGLILRRDF